MLPEVWANGSQITGAAWREAAAASAAARASRRLFFLTVFMDD
jgi:hypothetical protein